MSASEIKITPYWSVGQVAEALQVTQATIRRWIHAKQLPAVRVGGLLRISDADLKSFVNRITAPSRVSREIHHE